MTNRQLFRRSLATHPGWGWALFLWVICGMAGEWPDGPQEPTHWGWLVGFAWVGLVVLTAWTNRRFVVDTDHDSV